jgi:hypothetical protein
MLCTHTVTIVGRHVTLRPLTEDDWETLVRWNSDAEILYYSEGTDVDSLSLEQVQHIYRSVSQTALCFMIEVDDRPIGLRPTGTTTAPLRIPVRQSHQRPVRPATPYGGG